MFVARSDSWTSPAAPLTRITLSNNCQQLFPYAALEQVFYPCCRFWYRVSDWRTYPLKGQLSILIRRLEKFAIRRRRKIAETFTHGRRSLH